MGPLSGSAPLPVNAELAAPFGIYRGAKLADGISADGLTTSRE